MQIWQMRSTHQRLKSQHNASSGAPAAAGHSRCPHQRHSAGGRHWPQCLVGWRKGAGTLYLIKHWRNTIMPKRRGARLLLPDTRTHLSICVRPGWQGTYKRWLRAICNAAVPGERPLISRLMLRLCVEGRKNTCRFIAGHLSWAGSTLLNWPAETQLGC